MTSLLRVRAYRSAIIINQGGGDLQEITEYLTSKYPLSYRAAEHIAATTRLYAFNVKNGPDELRAAAKNLERNFE